jgi:hypothetical protein
LNGAAYAPFAVDHLAALLGSHSGAEADFAGTLDLAGFMGVMHLAFPSLLFSNSWIGLSLGARARPGRRWAGDVIR